MTLRRRLVASMIVLVALGVAAVDVITYTSLRSDLYDRVDDQLAAASGVLSRFVAHAHHRGFVVTPAAVANHVSPDLYVAITDAGGAVAVATPTRTGGQAGPSLPGPLTAAATASASARFRSAVGEAGGSAGLNVGSVGGRGPEYRLQMTALPSGTLVVATPLTSLEATLTSLLTTEVAVSLGLLAALAVLMTVLIRLELRPLEDMTRDAGAIADGDLSRRVHPSAGEGEIPRLGRALNGMLAQIESAFDQRTRSEDRLRSFLADASHELRTPLTSIRGYAELLRKDALGNPVERDRALSRIEQEAARMGALVGDLAVLAREGVEPAPARVRVDLAAVAAEAVADARAIDAARRIEFTADGEVPVAGDGARLEQMVHNLLGNALAHTPAGTPVVVGVAARGDRAVLRVRDQGPGMSAEQAGHVFDRFYRGDADRPNGGSGLGLFIVATLARTFGGEATVDTGPGQGATFEVVLPLDGGTGAGAANGGGRAGHH